MYALCDVKAMYASCEKAFDPAIRNKPVVVLTNNDGCICAACGFAEKAGVGKKFVPYFQVKDDLERVGAVIRSSNYELYADLSQRMMDTCSRFAPDSHIYSIDECFLRYGGYVPAEGWEEHAKAIRRTVWKEVKLPIGVGIGPTPTLAKAANHASKRIEGFKGICVLDSPGVIRYVLQNMDVTDVWGIGKRLGRRLNDLDIYTAWQLSKAKPALMRKHFSVLVENTVYELNGELRLSWDEVRAPKKEIFSTRSFGQRVTDPDLLRQALASHAEIAAAKLRKQSSVVKSMMVFAGNSPHDKSGYFRKSVIHHFTVPTADTRIIMDACTKAMDRIYRPGIRYYRCGVGLLDLGSADGYQHDMFTISDDKPELMTAMDEINSRFGRGSVHLAGKGIEEKFQMRREFLSPQYTTRWSDIPKIKCT